MKTLCVSQASTSICSSTMDQINQPSSSTEQLGGRALDRHNPIIGRRFTRSLPNPPCTSSTNTPISPKPLYQQLDKTKKPSSYNKKAKTKPPSNVNGNDKDGDIVRKSFGKLVGDFITPPASSRYLLSESGFLDGLSEYDPVVLPSEATADPDDDSDNKTQILSFVENKSVVSKPVSASFVEKKPTSDQVVVLKVSLHCKGCERKMRKHLSRMKGVRTFSIDFAAKMVTVSGEVTPLEVLASISKVKFAQIWGPPSQSVDTIINHQPKKI